MGLIVDKLYIRDTRSSSGTFLNHVRLSAPNQESKPFQLKDGDIVQLGVDYQGGYEGRVTSGFNVSNLSHGHHAQQQY